MRLIRIMLALVLVTGLSACASKFKTYEGPAVTLIQVQKTNRKMYLLHGSSVLKAYDVALGFAPAGHKQVEGDGRTPEGAYLINRRNPDSRYHLSLGVSYPDVDDVAFAQSVGMEPGGNIFVHGSNGTRGKTGDWTWGCIAVTDDEMEDIYAMVRDGTVIQILP